MKRVERPKIEQLSTGDQFHLVDMKLFEVIEGKNEPSSIRFEVPDTKMNKKVYGYVEDRNLLIFEGQYYIILVNHLDELGFKDCDAIQVGAELSLQTQENKVTGSLSIEEGLAHTFKGSNFKYINRCSKHNQLQFENFGGESRMKMIRKLLDRFDIECIFDNMTVIFADRIGKTTDKLYKFGYNVNAIKKTTDDSNCSFSVLLLGHKPSKEEGDGPQFTYYYESPLKYKMPELIRYRQAENIEDDKIKSVETARKRCEEAVNDIPVVFITVDHKEASFDDSNEPKVGDKAILQHHKYNMDFDVRVVKRTRYPFEQTPNVYEFSNKREELVDRTEEQKKWAADILSVVKELDKKLLEESNNYTDRINEMTDKKVEEAKKESEAAKKLAELVKENQKNFQTTIIESNAEPTTNLEPGKTLWLDTSKGRPGILKKWNGKTWDVIVPDVDAVKKEALEQVNKQVETTRTELNEKVATVQKEANGKYNEVKETVDGVNRTIKNVQNEQGDISKKITQMEQTSDGFKQSIESLNKKNETISNKINTVEQTVEGTKKLISDVQSDTNSLKKATTEIKEQAGQVSEKLTSVEKKFDDIKIGGQNFYKQKAFSAAGGTSVSYDDNNQWWNVTIPTGNKSLWKGIMYNAKNAILYAGRTYTISYEVYADEVVPLAVDINNTGVKTSTGSNDNDVTAKRIMRTPNTIPGKWTKASVTFTMPDNITQDFYDNSVLGVGGGWIPSKNTNIKIRNMQLEEGNIATGYRTPSEDQMSNEEFTKKTTEIVKSVEGIKENITKVESNQNKFEQRVTTVEKNAEGIKQSVSSIQETQTAQGKQIKEAKSTLEAQAEAIKAKVTITEVGNYVSSIGMDNLIRNSLLKTDSKHWSLHPNVVRDTNVMYNGSYSIKTDQIGLTADNWHGGISGKVKAVAGEDFVISGWFMTDDKSKIDKGVRIEIEFYNASGARISSPGFDIPLENNVWKFASGTAKAPAGTALVDARFYVVRNGKLWASKMMLQRGMKPSEFTENAMDVVGRDELLGQIAEKVATADYNKKTEQIDREIAATKEGISLSAKKTEVYTRVEADGKYATSAYVKTMESRIDVTEKSILSTVRVGNLISSINQTAEKIQIEAKRINLIGAVTAESIAGKLLEGITIRAKDPKDSNNFSEMSNGKVFTQGVQTPAQWNQWSKKVVTGLEKGSFYSKGYKENGTEANSLSIAAWGLNLNNGNDSATYGAGSLIINDKGQNKSITAKSYDEARWWRPSLQLDNPERGEVADITSDAIHFYNVNGRYQNEWVTESNASHLTLYKTMLDCSDHWNGKLQIKSGNGSSHNGVVATEFQTTSQRKLKTYIKDLQFNALQDVLDLQIKEYYFKSDVATLYEMRTKKETGQVPYTLKDIPKHYGFMVDDCPLPFTDEQRNGVNLYGSLSVTIKGFQQYVEKTDDRLNQIEKVINSENNSKHRNVRKSGGRTVKRSNPREKYLSGSRNRTRSGNPKVKRRK
ncbi:phage tail protein [Bacillus sp. 123MFChir2]|uniref:phage tail protein n=1 Tax=Bacillus sp. 123MFChir2 TaxID=1169144 RepID=UPI00035E7DBB|nr:phage tail protein [Bacillus sp. 123MFChir2]